MAEALDECGATTTYNRGYNSALRDPALNPLVGEAQPRPGHLLSGSNGGQQQPSRFTGLEGLIGH
jgi:hypothetical protein